MRYLTFMLAILLAVLMFCGVMSKANPVIDAVRERNEIIEMIGDSIP